MIEKSLFEYLSGFAGLSALVGTRIYPARAPQGGTYPLVIYQRTSGRRVQTMGGPTGLAVPVFQFDAWATDPLSAMQVADQLRYALDGYDRSRGAMGSTYPTTVDSIRLLEAQTDDWFEAAKLFRRTSYYEIAHREAVS